MCRFFIIRTTDLEGRYKRVVADVVLGLPSDDGEKGMRSEVEDYVGQMVYRERFGLSWEEFKQEPYRVYKMNTMIDTIVKQNRKNGNRHKKH